MSEWRVCVRCGDNFKIAWSDEEAMAEFARDFPGHDITKAVIVCDDCHRQMVELDPPPGRKKA